jgi:hypothetical protein
LDNGQALLLFFILAPFFNLPPVRPGYFPGGSDQSDPLGFRKVCQEFRVIRNLFQKRNTPTYGCQGILIVIIFFIRADGIRTDGDLRVVSLFRSLNSSEPLV